MSAAATGQGVDRVPLLVVSPHCDDAVFSCGERIARHRGAVVVTIFAGAPPSYEPFSEWDRASGFRPGDDVMALRREEDARALSLLDATPVWLPYCDSQYGRTPRVPDVAAALRERVLACRAAVVAFPLGLFHSDHALAHRATLALVGCVPRTTWIAYEDALYRRIPGVVQGRLESLAGGGWCTRAERVVSTQRTRALKRAAIACYRSQLIALATPGRPGHADAYERERAHVLALAKEDADAAA
jgi:LmbE family N-acetylglucosaminyl deacetylase